SRVSAGVGRVPRYSALEMLPRFKIPALGIDEPHALQPMLIGLKILRRLVSSLFYGDLPPVDPQGPDRSGGALALDRENVNELPNIPLGPDVLAARRID